MAQCKAKIKRGMKGSNGGRGRYEKTEVLKSSSKSLRRKEDKCECNEQLQELQEHQEKLQLLNKEIEKLREDSSEISKKIYQLNNVKKNIELEITDLEAQL